MNYKQKKQLKQFKPFLILAAGAILVYVAVKKGWVALLKAKFTPAVK